MSCAGLGGEDHEEMITSASQGKKEKMTKREEEEKARKKQFRGERLDISPTDVY